MKCYNKKYTDTHSQQFWLKIAAAAPALWECTNEFRHNNSWQRTPKKKRKKNGRNYGLFIPFDKHSSSKYRNLFFSFLFFFFKNNSFNLFYLFFFRLLVSFSHFILSPLLLGVCLHFFFSWNLFSSSFNFPMEGECAIVCVYVCASLAFALSLCVYVCT